MPDSPARICVVGSIHADLTVRTPRLPGPGETLLATALETGPGGKGANQAVAAARLGAAVTMIGAVGTDAHGPALVQTLAAESIDTSHIRADLPAPTGTALITVATGGENTIVVAPGAGSLLSPAHVESCRPAIAAADVLVAQLEIPLESVIRAAEIARSVGTTVMLNAAPGRRLPMELLSLVDVLVVNRTEAALILGHSPTDDPELDMLGVRTAIMTLGAEGAAYSFDRRGGRVPSYRVSAIDTVGAGDAFVGTLAVRWAEHQASSQIDHTSITDAICWACAAGALAATRPGAIPSLPRRDEVVRLLRTAENPT